MCALLMKRKKKKFVLEPLQGSVQTIPRQVPPVGVWVLGSVCTSVRTPHWDPCVLGCGSWPSRRWGVSSWSYKVMRGDELGKDPQGTSSLPF